MNRKILFKAKRLDNNEWIEGYYVVIDKKEYIFSGKSKDCGLYTLPILYEIDANTVCQYTGLVDKFGEYKIYENDIIKTNDGELRTVKYDRREGGFILESNIRKANLTKLYADEIEVQGNVFDNPELVKKISNQNNMFIKKKRV